MRSREAWLPRRLRTDGDRSDTGFTLIEMMVSMVVMSIFLAISTSGLIQLYRLANQTIAASDTQASVNLAFLRLDRQMRYGAGVSTPGLVGGDSYVEILTSVKLVQTCTELRVVTATGLLQQRTWPQGLTPLVPGPWTTIATGLTAGTPFVATDADGTFAYQRLQIAMDAAAGLGDKAADRRLGVTFTLLNTSLGTLTPTVCVEGRAVA
jgi:prepilin-type N-terminal cleavage/methylation domain-containing protein